MRLSALERDLVVGAIDGLKRDIATAEAEELSLAERLASVNDPLESLSLRLERDVAFCKLQGLHKAIQRLEVYLAPIQILPNELLSQIFIIGLQLERASAWGTSDLPRVDALNDDEDEDEDDESFNFACLVSHVSSHWRAVSLSTPMLWQKIIFGYKTVFERQWEWLRRSKSAPLDLRIAGIDKTSFSDVFGRLVQHASRIRRLTIMFRHKSNTQALSLLPREAPMLEYLDITASDPFKQEQLFNLGAPRLTTLTLDAIGLDWDNFPLDNIKKLVLRNLPPSSLSDDQLYTILCKTAPTIEWLVIYECAFSQDREPIWYYESDLVDLPNLHTLEINEEGDFTVSWFVTRFKHSRLRRLALQGYDQSDDIRHFLAGKKPFSMKGPSRSRALPRPFELVKEVFIETADNPSSLGEYVVAAYPAVERLHLMNDFDDHSVKHLLQSLHTGCPNLSWLHTSACPQHAMKDMIIARKQGAGTRPIQKLRVEVSRKMMRNGFWDWLSANVPDVRKGVGEGSDDGLDGISAWSTGSESESDDDDDDSSDSTTSSDSNDLDAVFDDSLDNSDEATDDGDGWETE